jgi:hypothetical protein
MISVVKALVEVSLSAGDIDEARTSIHEHESVVVGNGG